MSSNAPKQLCERQLDGSGVAGAGAGAAPARERYGTGYFTMDEDF